MTPPYNAFQIISPLNNNISTKKAKTAGATCGFCNKKEERK
jgi:hypothetical protein